MSFAGLQKTALPTMFGCAPATLRRRIKDSGLITALPKLTNFYAVIYGKDVPIIEEHLGYNPNLRKHFNLPLN